MTGDARPPTRWEALPGPGRDRYAERFNRLVREGADIHGEARLADAVAPRGARILDAGSGMGRVGAQLQARGHDVTAVEKDPELIDLSRRTFPDLVVIGADLAGISPALLRRHGRPDAYDLVVCVGNVMIFLAEGQERPVLGVMAALLAPGGRLLAGFDLRGGPAGSRVYPLSEFRADAEAAGLRVDLHAGTYDLRPPSDDFAVLLLSRSNEDPRPTAWAPSTGSVG